MSKLTGRIAIVTGGSKGIGKAISAALGAEGAAVVVNYASDAEGANHAVKEIESAGGRAVAVRADVSRPEDVGRLFAEAASAFGTVDVLVNNAAVYSFQPFEEIKLDEFHRQYDTNVLGVFLTAQEFVKQASPSGGAIVNISTSGILANRPGSALHTSTKGATTTITKILANELASRKIRVNAVAPGATDTDGARALGLINDDMVAMVVAGTPLGRLGQPDDIGPIVAFLASDDAKWVTGDVIFASGGFR